MRRPSTLLSLAIAGSLISASVPLSAQAGTLEFAPEAQDPALAEAAALYKEGKIKYETADYEEALALWKRAFAILPEGEENETIRYDLVYNIADAHSKAYEVSRNPTHLRKAKILLENYRADHRALYGDEPEAVKERTEVDDRIAELDKKIAASETAGETATPLSDGEGDPTITPPPDGQQPVPPPQPKPLSPSQQWERDIKADPQLGPIWVKGGKQVGGGAVLVGIGGFFTLVGAGLVVWGVGLRASYDPTDFVALNGTGAMISGGVFGVIGLGMLIPGAVVLASGVSKRNEVKRARPRPSGMLYPSMVPRGAGFGYTLRF